MDIFDELFAPNKNDFPLEINGAEKFGIIGEEEKGNKKIKNGQKRRKK